MSEVYYLLAAVSYGIFLVQFILSWFGGDTDLDVDLDGELDMNVSDIVSFKGLIHFIMGASGWLCVKQSISHSVEWYDYLIALVCGILFVVILYYLYKLCLKLQHQVIPEEGEAEAKAAEILKEAEAKANATKLQLEAEAEGTRKKLLAEAEGKRASLMAEADKVQAIEMAPALAVQKMIESGLTPEMVVQYKTVDQLTGIAEASAQMFEHVHLGQVTVYGNENTAGNFMAKTAENLNPAFDLLRSIPFADTLKSVLGKKELEEKKAETTEFEEVK